MTESIRVAMVVRFFDPWVGGMERQALKLAQALQRRGIGCRIVTGRWFRPTPRYERSGGVPIHRHRVAALGGRIKGGHTVGAFTFMATLAWWLLRHRADYDVIHVHGLSYHTTVAVMVGRFTNRPVVVKLANSGSASDILRMRSGAHLHGSRFLLRPTLRADRFVALNPTIRAELIAAGVPDSRIVEIPNGVEVAEDRCPEGPPRPEPGPSTMVRVVYTGRLHEQKNLDVLLRAAGRLTDRVHTELVGDGPHRPVLESLATSLDLENRITFTGEVADVGPHLAEGDIFVLPSAAEGLSNSLLEAMAAGLPVIVSDLPGNRVLVEDGVEGFLVDPGDESALAAAIQRLVEDAELRVRMGVRAHDRVWAHFSIDHIAERYHHLYDDLIVRAREAT